MLLYLGTFIAGVFVGRLSMQPAHDAQQSLTQPSGQYVTSLTPKYPWQRNGQPVAPSAFFEGANLAPIPGRSISSQHFGVPVAQRR